jgi:hypothetical protein
MSNILNAVRPAIAKVADEGLKTTLNAAFDNAANELSQIEGTFLHFAKQPWSVRQRCLFMKSWHSTHLKMLPIYGLTCRLQKQALTTTGERQLHYFIAAAHNAETSYEDLSVEMPEWRTHSQLFEELASSICGTEAWKLSEYCVPEADEFRQWLYSRMVFGDIDVGLFTNMFSEIYNHGEYSHALAPFQNLMKTHYGIADARAEELSLYIECHVESDVEEDHFNCMVKALNHYNQAAGRSTDYNKAEQLFCEYLSRSAKVMQAIEQRLV